MPLSTIVRLVFPFVVTALAAPSVTLAQATGRAGFFAQSDRSTASADVAEDSSGALHMGFIHYEPEAEGAAAVYAICSDGAEVCASFDAWRVVELGQGARDAQVAVTEDGRPRLLIAASSQSQPGGVDYIYAECDVGCDQTVNWRQAIIATSWDNSFSAILSDRMPQRTFVLDGAGRPMFLYSDRNYLIEPDHYGTFWMSCKSGCSDRANWTETDLARHSDYDTEIFDEPVLAISPDGRPRVVTRLFGLALPGEPEPKEGLYYLACDTGCTSSASWRRTWVNETGGGSYPSPTWDLAIDGRGRPRIALFTGDGMEQADLSNNLVYLWCNEADCTTSDQVWTGNAIIGEGHGEMADLELDAEGRPRAAFRTSDGSLGFAWCDTDCEISGAPWDGLLVEGQAQLASERPTALPFTCDGEVWEALSPQFLLAKGTTPMVAYDVSVEARCLYQDFGDPQITYEFHPLWRGARLVSFAP